MAAIAIGALVPAAVMSIAAANLYTRNIHLALSDKPLTDAQETTVAKVSSLIVKIGALTAVLFLPAQFSIYYQLFAGSLVIQTLPTVLFGLYTKWFHRHALLAGWATGIALALWMIVASHFVSTFTIVLFGVPVSCFIAVWALAADLIVAVALTFAFDALKIPRGADRTSPDDYVEAATYPLPH
jgi:SSS family solute:Na+ symporter